MWGRGRAPDNDHEFNYGTKAGVYLDALRTRLDGRAGFHSRAATRRLLAKLDEIHPDVVHLHNLHGYHVHVGMLFDWLARSGCQVRWTLHDCWAFTGHCAHFTYVGCDRWRDGSCGEGCPQLGTYPKTVSRSGCARNFEDKRRVFNMLPADRMTLITPSRWLAGLVEESFLSKYPVEVRHNTIDTKVFRPTPSDFRERYGIGDRFMVLGVASPWTERKGLPDFVRLARELDSDGYAIVLVGLSSKQIKKLKKELTALPGTDSEKSLAEAQACGTPAIVTEGSACAAVADGSMATAVPADLSTLRATVLKPAGGGRLILMERTESSLQLAAVYTGADVFFNPTREDNYPTVNLEAQACGVPIVAYDVGGCAETVWLPRSVVVRGYEECLPLFGKMREEP